MKRPAFFRFASGKTLFAFVGLTALALAPQIALAQHGGGGHAGGGASAGGHASPGAGGGGSPHFSSPPAPQAPHYSPPPPHVVTPPSTYVPPPAAYVPPPAAGAVNNAVVDPAPVMNSPATPGSFPRAAGFVGTPVANPTGNATNSQPDSRPVTGFASPTAATQPVDLYSTTPDAMRARSGQPRRFVGEGHQIYSEPAGATGNSSTASAATTARRQFVGAAGLASATPGAPPHVFPPHRRVPPIIVNPGFGTFGFGGFGYGFGSPFFGSPFYFGDPYFFGDPFFGFGYGSVFDPCNGFGEGFQCMPYNSNFYSEQPYTSTMIGGTETETQSQQIFSPYSPAPPQPEDNTNGPSSDEYVLYLKDGAVYVVNDYWYQDGKLVYSTATGQDSVDLDRIDMQKTLDVNAQRGLVFTLRPAQQQPEAQPDQSAPAQPDAMPPEPDQAPPDQNAPAPAPQP